MNIPDTLLLTQFCMIFALLSATVALAAEWHPIETKPQDPLIHPIAPEDGVEVTTNPPAMVFWYSPLAVTYTVEMSQHRSFEESITVSGMDLPFYNHTETLPSGEWYWRYYFQTKDGNRSDYSPVRSFQITSDSIHFPVPTTEDILSRMPDHPRIYTTKATLPDFRVRKDGNAAQAFTALVRSVQRSLRTDPQVPKFSRMTPEHRKMRALAFWLEDNKGHLALNVRPSTLEHESEATRDLALLYLVTGQRKYAEAARKRLLWQANFRIDYHQPEKAHHDTVHCYEYGLQRMASCYDSIYDVLSMDERKKVLDAIEYHGDAAYRKLRFKVKIHLKYQSSHPQQDMHELVTTALAVAKDLPAARTWLAYLIPQYVNRLAWGKNDGGYSEGHYYNYKWHGMLRCAVSLKNAAGIDLFRKPRFVNAGRFWLYCMSLNYWWNHYGDNFSLHTPLAGNGNDRDIANFMASVYQDRYVKWWADQIDGSLKMPLWYLSDETLVGKPPVDIPQSAVFPDVGWVSMYDKFYDNNSTRLFLKCSPWGSHSHSHQDQNGFVLHAFGEILAIDKGYYGYYGDEYHKLICRETKSHNSILVNGQGQDRGIQYNGHIVDFFDSDSISFVTGDATAAYGGRLRTFLRSVLFIRPNYFIIYDQLEASEASEFSWQLNSFLKMSLDRSNQTVTIHGQKAELKVTHLLPDDLRYRQSNEREYELKARYTEAFPEHWTCWCETSDKSKSMRFLTVLEPYKIEDGPSAKNIQKIESERLLGVSFHVGEENYRVLFQKDMASPVRASYDSIQTDAKCTVVRESKRNPGFLHHFHVAGTVLEVDGRMLFESETPRSFDSAPYVITDLSKTPEVSLAIEDSQGTYEAPLEKVADRRGSVFYFARLDPREQGRYDIVVHTSHAEIFVQDKWDPAHSSQGVYAELREGSMLIVKTKEALQSGQIRAELKESYKGRIVSLLRNGDFEVGIPGYPPTGWWVRHFSSLQRFTKDLSFVYWSDESPAEGDHCLKIVRMNNKIRSYSQGIEVAKPGRYVIRFKARATCKGANINTWGTAGSFGIDLKPSTEWKEYRVEADLVPGTAVMHCMFDEAEGPNQVLWVDDLEFGRVSD